MAESEATFALPAPLDPNGQPVAGDPASALLRAAPVSNAERWVTEADEQIRRGRLGTPAGDNARDSLLAAQRSDASYLGLPAAVDRFVDASADRSEEHTSELQSLMRISYAVFCLKKTTNNHSSYIR